MENAWFDKTALIMCSESEAWSIGFIRPTGNSFYNQEPHDKILFIEETYLGCRHLGAVSRSGKAASPVSLTFLKSNFFLKLSNRPLLALNFPALDP